MFNKTNSPEARVPFPTFSLEQPILDRLNTDPEHRIVSPDVCKELGETYGVPTNEAGNAVTSLEDQRKILVERGVSADQTGPVVTSIALPPAYDA